MKLIDTCDMAKITISERCNLSCPFCENSPDRKEELSSDEISKIALLLRDAGVTKVKLCGGTYGEPLLREDILDIVSKVKDIGIESIGIATNGTALTKDLAVSLASAGVTWITHSVTTLNPSVYHSMYRCSLKSSSLEAVETAKMFERYQLNCVLLKGINDSEIDNIVEFGHRNGAYVQFMEMVELSTNREFYINHFLDAEPLKANFFSRCLEYYYNKGNMRHQYQFESGVVTIKQTRHERSACLSCKRVFVNSEGKIWFCSPENILVDFKTAPKSLLDPALLKTSLTNRFNSITDNRLRERMAFGGCLRACD